MQRLKEGARLSEDDALALFGLEGKEIFELAAMADDACQKVHSNRVSFVINRNINFTNVCQFNCKFCAFHVSKESDEAFFLDPETVRKKTAEARVIEPGCTEICIQGGLHPDLIMERIEAYLKAIKSVDSTIHVHGFSPQEIWNLSKIEKSSLKEIISRLKDAGLGSVPGTAAEILVDSVRKKVCPSKVTTDQWRQIIIAVHESGLRSTSTIMYGHIEEVKDIVEHFKVIRDIQEKTGGFTEFVPLPFQRDGLIDEHLKLGALVPNGVLDMKLHAISRLYFKGYIDNIQVSWVKLGKKFCQVLLYAGVNDFSGTLMEENISKAAGATHGEYISSSEMVDLIKAAGRTPVQRSTTYEALHTY